MPPDLRHPRSTSIGIADYGKLERLLADAFHGTAQPTGARLPIVYGEYGVETTVPPADAAAYSGHEVVRTVDDATQARYYRRAIELAACQPNVTMLLFFHVIDETSLQGLQSGLYSANGTAKQSVEAVRRTPLTCSS